jgi:hypothetical protein
MNKTTFSFTSEDGSIISFSKRAANGYDYDLDWVFTIVCQDGCRKEFDLDLQDVQNILDGAKLALEYSATYD